MLARIKIFESVLKCAHRLEGATAIAVNPCVAPAPAPSHIHQTHSSDIHQTFINHTTSDTFIRHIRQIFIISRFETPHICVQSPHNIRHPSERPRFISLPTYHVQADIRQTA